LVRRDISLLETYLSAVGLEIQDINSYDGAKEVGRAVKVGQASCIRMPVGEMADRCHSCHEEATVPLDGL
jgi:hypothetical protein